MVKGIEGTGFSARDEGLEDYRERVHRALVWGPMAVSVGLFDRDRSCSMVLVLMFV